MLRRLHPEQPESFAFTPANQAWAEGQITKYPDGRQPSAIIPLLFRAQEQEGWLSRAAIEHIADMLGMAHIRALEVATFYFMFQLQPVGSVAHIQVCGTTSCMICGAEDLIEVCRKLIAENPHEVSEDGKLSWEEVECLGSCTNAPMAQIGKDYYEDLTADKFASIIRDLRMGKVPVPGPQNGRMGAEPRGGLTSLKEFAGDHDQNASVALAGALGDTIKRIDGTEVPLLTPWTKDKDAANLAKPVTSAATGAAAAPAATVEAKTDPKAKAKAEAEQVAAAPAEADAPKKPKKKAKKAAPAVAEPAAERQPETLSAARDGGADDLKQLKGVGPKLEQKLNEMGFYHFDQIAAWTEAEIAWVDSRLSFKGRIERDGWVDQAKTLAEGGSTEFSNKVKKGDVY